MVGLLFCLVFFPLPFSPVTEKSIVFFLHSWILCSWAGKKGWSKCSETCFYTCFRFKKKKRCLIRASTSVKQTFHWLLKLWHQSKHLHHEKIRYRKCICKKVTGSARKKATKFFFLQKELQIYSINCKVFKITSW